MNKDLKDLRIKLRPYNYFTVLFRHEGSSDPTIFKVLHNDFKVVPDISAVYRGSGFYEFTISNFTDLGLNTSDIINLECEIMTATSATYKASAFLNVEHTLITVYTFELSFGTKEDLNGVLALTYYKLI